jgi:hypothetical protein
VMSDHKANAEKLIDDVDDILDEAGREQFTERQGMLSLIEATRAQALATLYLAEQQRIANLIALAEMFYRPGFKPDDNWTPERLSRLGREIVDGLGFS